MEKCPNCHQVVETEAVTKQSKSSLYGVPTSIVEVGFGCPSCGHHWGFLDDPEPKPVYSGPDDPKLKEDFTREFAGLYSDERGIGLEMTMLDAYCLLAVVQLASRHPQAQDNLAVKRVVEIVKVIQAYFTTPALAKVTEAGWNPEHDKETAPAKGEKP